MERKITACIVLYKNDRILLKKAIDSFLSSEKALRLYLIDNSPTDDLNNICYDKRVEYIRNPSNPGFGSAHNIAIKKAIEMNVKYHLVINPDVYFAKGILENIYTYLEENHKVGVLMPKVIYPNGKIQYLAKLIPSPLDFLVRRLVPIKILKEKLTRKFELRFSNYDKIIRAPYLSGCFLFFRTEVLKDIQGFDENIFMHMEDLDITRRVIEKGYNTIFYPNVSVYHDHEIKSFKNLKTFMIYIKSAIYYFNKWGWIKDTKRILINKQTLSQF